MMRFAALPHVHLWCYECGNSPVKHVAIGAVDVEHGFLVTVCCYGPHCGNLTRRGIIPNAEIQQKSNTQWVRLPFTGVNGIVNRVCSRHEECRDNHRNNYELGRRCYEYTMRGY